MHATAYLHHTETVRIFVAHIDHGLRTSSVVDLGHLLWDGEAGLTVITGADGRPINATTVDVSGPQAVAS